MDHYFEWYEMLDACRMHFAKMKLVGQAKMHWLNVERLLTRGGQVPILSWDEMKEKLKEKYLPNSYRQRLLDQWHHFA